MLLRVADDKVGPGGVRVKCPGCESVLSVKRPAAAQPPSPAPSPAPAPAPAPAPEIKPASSVDDDFFDVPSDTEDSSGMGGSLNMDSFMDEIIPVPHDGPPPETPQQPGQQNFRKQTRVPFREEILIDDSILVNGIDLSEGGIYVHTGRSFVVGSEVTVALPLIKGALRLKALVQHDQPGVGMGLHFEGLDEGQKTELHRLIESIEFDQGPSEPTKTSVLIVEDNDTARRISKSSLVLADFQVSEAKGGVEALKSLSSALPDLILLDLNLEDMDGLSLLRTIKQNPAWKEIKIIILTGKSDKEVMDNAYAAGADKFFVKMTTSPAKLASEIRDFLKEHEQG